MPGNTFLCVAFQQQTKMKTMSTRQMANRIGSQIW